MGGWDEPLFESVKNCMSLCVYCKSYNLCKTSLMTKRSEQNFEFDSRTDKKAQLVH